MNKLFEIFYIKSKMLENLWFSNAAILCSSFIGTAVLGMLVLTTIRKEFPVMGDAWLFTRYLLLFRNSLIEIVIFFNILGLFFACSQWVISYVAPYVALESSSIFPWFLNAGEIDIYWNFSFDNVTAPMTVVVIFISILVQIYSLEYMEHDPSKEKFFFFLNMFTFFMLVLLTAGNLVQLFIGWEGVGLCSYLLINFWHTRIQANKAALKALLMNRVGDYFFILAVAASFSIFKTVQLSDILNPRLVQYVVDNDNTSILTGTPLELNRIDLLALFLFLAAAGKSAQLGLHTWLPDAMEGPTPVSALIHAATMVTAGVFLIIKCSTIFEYSPKIQFFVGFVGLSTTLFAGTVSVFQNDIKKIVAYSTCSQLGYMVFCCGLHYFSLSLFHLINHAFFKALLFLASGAVIHSLNGEQDIRKMGGLANVLPITYTTMLIGSLSLMGSPFLTGFYSKDKLLEAMFSFYTNTGYTFYWVGFLAALLTSLYSVRLLFLVFLKTNNSHRTLSVNIHECGIYIKSVLLLLAFFSIVAGYGLQEILFSLDFYKNNFNVIFTKLHYLSSDEFFKIPVYVKFLPFLGTIFIVLMLFYFYKNLRSLKIWLSEFFLLLLFVFVTLIFYYLSKSLFGYLDAPFFIPFWGNRILILHTLSYFWYWPIFFMGFFMSPKLEEIKILYQLAMSKIICFLLLVYFLIIAKAPAFASSADCFINPGLCEALGLLTPFTIVSFENLFQICLIVNLAFFVHYKYLSDFYNRFFDFIKFNNLLLFFNVTVTYISFCFIYFADCYFTLRECNFMFLYLTNIDLYFLFALLALFMQYINYLLAYPAELAEVSCSLSYIKLFLNKKWFFDSVYSVFGARSFGNFSYEFAYKFIDKGLLEFFGPVGAVKLVRWVSKGLKCLQNGFLFNYNLLILLSFVLLFQFFIFF